MKLQSVCSPIRAAGRWKKSESKFWIYYVKRGKWNDLWVRSNLIPIHMATDVQTKLKLTALQAIYIPRSFVWKFLIKYEILRVEQFSSPKRRRPTQPLPSPPFSTLQRDRYSKDILEKKILICKTFFIINVFLSPLDFTLTPSSFNIWRPFRVESLKLLNRNVTP